MVGSTSRKASKTPFVIITLPRSGSYHLRALLDSAPDIRCYGEIFKGSEVELPPEELALLGLGKKDTDKRDELGMALLNRLRKKTDAEGVIFGFKDFRFNLTRVKIYQQMLNSKGWRKVFLFRNPIERYISMERADLTGVFVVTEKNKDAGLDLKRPIRFDAARFEKSMGSHRRLHEEVVTACRPVPGQPVRRLLSFEVASSTAENDNHSVATSEASIQRVLDRFHGITQRLSSSSELLRQESLGIRDEISEVLVALQFQDRVSQIVGHVTDDMRRLQARLREEGEIDCQGWLRQLESSYTTLEQQRAHSGDARAHVEQSSVTFF